MTNSWRTVARAAVVTVAAVALAACGHGGNLNTATSAAAESSSTADAGSDPMAGMDHGTMAPMPGMDGMGGPIGDGTRNSEFGFTLTVKTRPTGVGRLPITLVVTGPKGAPVLDAQVEQTKKMHLIAVRRDLTGYQHRHPALAADGTWSVDIDFSTPGRWHLIADVTPIVPGTSSARVALGADLEIPGSAPADAALPAPAHSVNVDGYDITLDGTLSFTADQPLTFTIDRDGAPATGITEYLGAGGHLVALEQRTLGYTHLHPDDGPGPELSFTARAPRAGRYRLFLQFATGDTVHTAAFTVDVA